MSLWRNVFRRTRVERDLDDELRSTIELLVDEKVGAGMSADEARRAALLELGAVESVKDAVRDVRRGSWLEVWWRDLRYGTRLLRRNPLFTATAVLSIAIGIGAATTVFTVANGLLFRPAAGVTDPATVVDIIRTQPRGGTGLDPISYPDYLDIRSRATSFEHVYAYRLQPDSVSLGVGAGVEAVFATTVSPNYFQALGVGAAAGRTFGSVDSEQPNASPVLVLSHAFWLRRFGGDSGIVGETVRINGTPFTVVGVAPAGFTGAGVVASDVYVPLAMMGVVQPDGGIRGLTQRNVAWLMLGGRLADGVSREQASAEIAVIGNAIDREYPEARGGGPPSVPVQNGREQDSGEWVWSAEAASPIPYSLRWIVAAFVGFLMAIVWLVLIIACTNVAGVLLARATVRRREMAVRAALGAARRRIVSQLLTETLLLFVLGGVAGLGLARVLTTLLVNLLPRFDVPIAVSTPLDVRVIAFSLGTALVTAVIFGLAPALHAARADVVEMLKDDVQGPSDRLRLRKAFVVAQVALSTLLVVVALLLTRTLGGVSQQATGFNPVGVDIVSIDLAASGYNAASGRQVARQIIERVRTLPGVEQATLADRVPGPGVMSLGIVTVPGVPPPAGRPAWLMNWTLIEPGYFETLQIPLTAGRDMTEADRTVAIVGEVAASILWPDVNPLGQTLFVSEGPGATATALTVIGVARDMTADTDPQERLALYVPFQQRYGSRVTIFTKTSAEDSLAGELSAAVRAIDPDLLVLQAERMNLERTGPIQMQLRVAAVVTSVVGVVGLLLAAMGVYGVTAFAVARRTREIGIRLTLGAAHGDVVRLVLRQGMGLVATGSIIGLLLGAGVGRALSQSPLRAVPVDPLTFLGVATLLGLVGLAACYAPVRRAVRTTPVEALRHE